MSSDNICTCDPQYGHGGDFSCKYDPTERGTGLDYLLELKRKADQSDIYRNALLRLLEVTDPKNTQAVEVIAQALGR